MTGQIDRTRRPFVIDEAVAILARTPATLDALLRGLPDGWIVAHEGGETWSPFDVIGHLIHGERTDWVPRARIILEHGEARAFDTFDRFAQFAVSKGRTLASLLDELAALRQKNLRELATLRLTDAGNTNFNGTFMQANNSAGNYARFTITAGGFTLTAIPGQSSAGSKRAPVNGIQIVPR